MPPKVPSMDVIAAMTTVTGLRDDDFVRHFLAVTTLAFQLLVRATQTKIRLLVMIERPDPPSVGGVTETAATAKTPFMNVVVVIMATAADPLRPAITLVEMAILTAGQRMQAEQRETAQIMIEDDRLVPAIRVVTLGAVLAQLTAMNIIVRVTTAALRIEIVTNISALVTGHAMDIAVTAKEWIVGIPVMTKIALLPAVLAMTVVTFPAITTLVPVFLFVAGDTLRLQLLLVQMAIVTGRAADLGMTPAQAVLGILVVVKLYRFPAPFVVTVSAFGAKLAAMLVIDLVTADALARNLDETAIGVTGATGGLFVRVTEGEIRLVMVES